MSLALIFLMFVARIFVIIYSEPCSSFRNITLEVRNSDGVQFNQEVNDCIDDVHFGSNKIRTIHVVRENIRKLGEDSVRNMKHLYIIQFLECKELADIEPMSFKNTPQLKTLQISDSARLNEIRKGVFNMIPELQTLIIDKNGIDFIEMHAFANLSNLKELNAQNNKLEYWNRDWFDDNIDLEKIIFFANRVHTLSRRAFARMSKLRHIDFNNNEIESIHPHAFSDLKYLSLLGLRHNRLLELNGDIFPNKLMIKFLDIGANYLNALSSELLIKVSVEMINMHYNPWKCPCMDRIYYWIYTTNATLIKTFCTADNNIPICAIPNVFSQTCLEYVDEELTDRYLNRLIVLLSAPSIKSCARLD